MWKKDDVEEVPREGNIRVLGEVLKKEEVVEVPSEAIRRYEGRCGVKRRFKWSLKGGQLEEEPSFLPEPG